jgi:uncharacterized membrane protein
MITNDIIIKLSAEIQDGHLLIITRYFMGYIKITYNVTAPKKAPTIKYSSLTIMIPKNIKTLKKKNCLKILGCI